MAEPLNPDLLIEAYREGFFPMSEPDSDEINWFRPDPRAILPPENFHCSHSLQKIIRQKKFTITYNKTFIEVMRGCADREETWISEAFISAYGELHRRRQAHSVEAWADNKLVGGVYGVTIGGAFFAESKFHTLSNASKVALYYLVKRLKEKSFSLLEIQFLTPHLRRMGAITVPDHEYLLLLKRATSQKVDFDG